MTRIAAAAVTIVIGWFVSMSSAHADPEPPPPPAPHGEEAPPPGQEARPGPLTAFGDGTYTVGTDIVPGVYQSAGPVEGGVCYWKRANSEGTVANAMTKKPQTVEIAPGDTTFKSSKCQEWQKTDAPPPAQPNPGDILGQLGSLIGQGAIAPRGGG